jgi:hypothetical protein
LIIFGKEHAIVDNIEYFFNKFWWNWWNYLVEYSIKNPKRILRMGQVAPIILCAPCSEFYSEVQSQFVLQLMLAIIKQDHICLLINSIVLLYCWHLLWGVPGEPKAIPWTHHTPLWCVADSWVHLDMRRGDVICWPTNLGPMILYFALLNGATLALYNGSPLGRGFGKFVQVINQLSLKINIFHSLLKVFPLCYFVVQVLMRSKFMGTPRCEERRRDLLAN